MTTKIIEAQSQMNCGKFMVAKFDHQEWSRMSEVDPQPLSLVSQLGWTHNHIFVLDLATGEGALFRPGSMPVQDLDRHKVWVCPMFEPFLTWLYKQDLLDLDTLPSMITIPQEVAEKHEALAGYRRPGPEPYFTH